MSPIYNNDPRFGTISISNPQDEGKGCCTAAPVYSYSYFCGECENYRTALTAERNAHAKDNIENSRIGDHLRSQLAKMKKELAQVEEMHRAQASTIMEKFNELGHKSEIIADYEEQIEDLKAELSGIKARNLDPEPHALKAAVLVMQKQLDELNAALDKARTDGEACKLAWSRAYDTMLHSLQTALTNSDKESRERLETIKTLERKLLDFENNYCCECDSRRVPQNEALAELGLDNSNKQRTIEEQNRMIGAKQEEINNLKVALNKAKSKQTFELKPADAIVKAYEDKLQRLLNIVASKEAIIEGLRNHIRNS